MRSRLPDLLSGGTPLETVAEAERRARARLPRAVYTSLLAGGEQGVTMTDNVRAFGELTWVPRVGARSWPPALATEVLGMDLELPILLAPVGSHAIHPGGEVAAAAAAAAYGTGLMHSSFASQPFEAVAALNDRAIAQLYWLRDRAAMREYVERAKANGSRALVLTMDVIPGPAPRDWGTPRVPERLSVLERARQVPTALTHPRWTLSHLLGGGLPTLALPNLRTSTDPTPTLAEGRRLLGEAGSPSWDDVAWLRSLWDGPFVVKGVTHPGDARQAVAAGATAVGVSNHGGNNLDGTPSAVRLLPAIRSAVGDEAEILYDGGIRRGGDVAKALALGADAVLVGRPWLFGLAARGGPGVADVLRYLRDGLARAVTGLGHDRVQDLTADDLVIPPGFTVPVH